MSEKKLAKATGHLTLEEKEQIGKIAELEGFTSESEYVRSLIIADLDTKRSMIDSLADIFGYAKRAKSAERAPKEKAAFSRKNILSFSRTGTDS